MAKGISIALLLFFAVTVSSQESPCPKPEDISPCVCEVQKEDFSFMDCTQVKDEEDLARVFKSEFPNNHIDHLYFNDNQGVTYLSNGVFGNISFQEFEYTGGVLEAIGGGVFEKSQQTLQLIKINDCSSFTDFSLDGTFDLMDNFELRGTPVTEFPLLDCPNLKQMKVSAHQLLTIPEDPYSNMPLLEMAAISFIGSKLPDVLFTEQHKYLKYVFIANDNISYLQIGPLSSVNVANVLNLNFNDDEFEMEEGAFASLQNTHLELFATHITTVEEHLWRPLLDGEVTLVFNEIICDCSVKWLVDEPSLIDLVKYTEDLGLFFYKPAKCTSGENLEDLDPADFVNC